MVNNIRRKLINPDSPTYLMNETLSRYHMKANFQCRCFKEKCTAGNKNPTAWRKLLEKTVAYDKCAVDYTMLGRDVLNQNRKCEQKNLDTFEKSNEKLVS